MNDIQKDMKIWNDLPPYRRQWLLWEAQGYMDDDAVTPEVVIRLFVAGQIGRDE